MSKPTEIRCYEYVNRPYAAIRELLVNDALGLFHRATSLASERASELAAQLKVNIAGFEIGKDIHIEITKISTDGHGEHSFTTPATSIELAWRASSHDALFPSMRAELVAYALSESETQLDLRGWYTPPGSVIGSAVDALLGHRLAQASIHRFLQETVARMRIDTR